jgi:hypothetical protein
LLGREVKPTLMCVCNSLYSNDFDYEGAKALGTACRDELKVSLSHVLAANFEMHRNRTRLIRQFGATPLNRFRLYLCGFGGVCVCVCFCDLVPVCICS